MRIRDRGVWRVILSAAIFAVAGVLFWCLGGWGERLLAIVILTGGALSLAFQAAASARRFRIACVPLLALLQTLPLVSIVTAPAAERHLLALISVAVLLFIAQFLATRRTSVATARKMRRSLREAHRERRRAEAASAARSDVLGAMGHELRTPLNGVLGMAQAMGAYELSLEQRERLDVIRRSGEVLLMRLNEVLDSRAPGIGWAEADMLETPGLAGDLAHVSLTRAGQRLRVLAAEDNPTNQLVLKTLLAQFDITVHVVDDGAEAIAAWRSARWDLVLMDIRMPGVDGLAATRAIRAEEAADGRPRTPIIAITADATAAQTADYLALGLDGLAPKPIQLAQLVAVIAGVLEHAWRDADEPQQAERPAA